MSSSYQDTCALHVDDARFHAIHRLSGQTCHGAACHGTSKVQTQIVGKASLQCLAFPSLRGCSFSNPSIATFNIFNWAFLSAIAGKKTQRTKGFQGNMAFEMVKLYRVWYSANRGTGQSWTAFSNFVPETETKVLETKATMFPGQILDLGIHCHLKLQIQFDRLIEALLVDDWGF